MPSSGKEKYKYIQLVSGRGQMKSFCDDLRAIRSEPLKPVAEAFEANMKRLRNLAVTWAEIATHARRDAALLFHTEYEITGKIAKPFTQESRNVPDAVSKEFHKRLKNFLSSLTPEDNSKLVYHLGIDLVDIMLEDTEGMQKSMEALLSSLIVSYWTVFESLAPDLWKASVNHGPAKLRQRVNLATQDKPDPKIAEHWKDNLQCDPGEDYAGSLIEAGRVPFRKLERIIHWYSVVFEGKARQIFKDNRDIHALSAYRNAFVHNSGRADKDFIKQIEAVDDLRGKFVEKQLLEVDGEFVSRLRTSVFSVGLKLLQLADDLITPQPGDIT